MNNEGLEKRIWIIMEKIAELINESKETHNCLPAVNALLQVLSRLGCGASLNSPSDRVAENEQSLNVHINNPLQMVVTPFPRRYQIIRKTDSVRCMSIRVNGGKEWIKIK